MNKLSCAAPVAALHELPPPRTGLCAEKTLMVRPLDQALRILRMKQLIERTNLSRATLYVLMTSDPTFPRKIKLTARSIGFLESEVNTWIATRAEMRGAV